MLKSHAKEKRIGGPTLDALRAAADAIGALAGRLKRGAAAIAALEAATRDAERTRDSSTLEAVMAAAARAGLPVSLAVQQVIDRAMARRARMPPFKH